MRFRFGRGLTLLRGGNSGTSKIGEDVLYITALEKGLRKMESGGMFWPGMEDLRLDLCMMFSEIPLRSLRMVVSLQK